MSHKLFSGIRIYELSWMKKGMGVCLPPLGVFVCGGASLALKQHEYGHYLQYKGMGFWRFYLNVGIPSLRSAIFNPQNHSTLEVEKDANRRAVAFFGKAAPINNPNFWPVSYTDNPIGAGGIKYRK